MARFCTECGSRISDGVMFCTQCGAKAKEPALVPQQKNEVQPALKSIPQPAAEAMMDKTVGTGTFFGLMFLFSLPILGWLICVIMAFVPQNRNIRNFARAMLIWLIIALVIGAIIGVAVGTLIGPAVAYLEEAAGELGGLRDFGELDGLVEEFGTLEDMMGQLEGMVPAE